MIAARSPGSRRRRRSRTCKRLGVTAVELLPIHAHADEPALVRRGLTNYWGYNTLGYFAPDPRFVAPDARLDAVASLQDRWSARCTPPASRSSSTSSTTTPPMAITSDRRSRCAASTTSSSYRLQPGRLSRYVDWTGCGNTLDARSPAMQRLVLDSLRYWVEDMHVDGFRFDLATSLLRGDNGEVDWRSAWLRAIDGDPVLSRVKLIAEPWDAAPGGYQLGGFPPAWSEWNDRYRDDVRRFWRGDAGIVDDLATRLAGSRDLFGRDGRSPRASINFVTAHDGFTLADLVAYNEKHNEANGEQNRDGTRDNASWNSGVEGRTDDPEILALRSRQRRNFMLTLAVSQGVPMLERRRRDEPHAARQQQRLLSRRPADLDAVGSPGRGARLPRVRRPRHRAPRRASRAAARHVSRRPERRRRGRGLAAARRTRDDRRTTGAIASGARSACCSTAIRRRAASVATRCSWRSTPRPIRSRSRRRRIAAWEIVLDTTDPSLPVVPVPDGLPFPMAEHSAVVLVERPVFRPAGTASGDEKLRPV